eukprot:Clim_evm5s82 gene=Clim_evmTU5s82
MMDSRKRQISMNLNEKLLCHNAVGLKDPWVKPGDVICIKVQWTLASELSWSGMEKTYQALGRPKIFRNDRVWLAVDHTVDPRNYHEPKQKKLITQAENFAKEAGLSEYQPPNQTILHTEFCRERVLPGQIVIGADSHTCSAGSMGAWAAGLGAADVVMPMVTGETWMRVPETIRIDLVGNPPFGIGGKDIILHVMGYLKRNTVAFERAVEWGGNLNVLSCDARFAIANMTTEFGGIVGVFPADEVVHEYIVNRQTAKYRGGGKYMKADDDAKYAERYKIDLSDVDSLVALYPSPDDVVHVDKAVGKKLDGVFVGACTTAEEDLVLGALVLDAAMKEGRVPIGEGKRRVTPGSVNIVAKMRKWGLLEIYQRAGFEVGAPGCSYCVGVSYDRAAEGEVWLSSQNRNFRNRMGEGSIGNLASAATVCASSFDMQIENPRKYLDKIDKEKFEKYFIFENPIRSLVEYTEPEPELIKDTAANGAAKGTDENKENIPIDGNVTSESTIVGKPQIFGDNIDTDAIIPAEFMPGESDEDLGTHCFQFFKPDFRDLVKKGHNIIVAGHGFGSGSSREEAVRALMGIGVQAVIARGFAFIYHRNQPNMGLLGIVINDDTFYCLAEGGHNIYISLHDRSVTIDNQKFPFQMTNVELKMLQGGGMINLYAKYEKAVLRHITNSPIAAASYNCGDDGQKLSW